MNILCISTFFFLFGLTLCGNIEKRFDFESLKDKFTDQFESVKDHVKGNKGKKCELEKCFGGLFGKRNFWDDFVNEVKDKYDDITDKSDKCIEEESELTKCLLEVFENGNICDCTEKDIKDAKLISYRGKKEIDQHCTLGESRHFDCEGITDKQYECMQDIFNMKDKDWSKMTISQALEKKNKIVGCIDAIKNKETCTFMYQKIGEQQLNIIKSNLLAEFQGCPAIRIIDLCETNLYPDEAYYAKHPVRILMSVLNEQIKCVDETSKIYKECKAVLDSDYLENISSYMKTLYGNYLGFEGDVYALFGKCVSPVVVNDEKPVVAKFYKKENTEAVVEKDVAEAVVEKDVAEAVVEKDVAEAVVEKDVAEAVAEIKKETLETVVEKENTETLKDLLKMLETRLQMNQ